MFSVVYVTVVLLALLTQTSPVLFTVGPGLRVDLALMVVVYVSLFWGWKQALVLGFLTGFCQDALSSEVLGLSALSKTLTAFVVHTWSRHVHVQSLTVQMLFTCLAVAVDTIARLVVLVVFQLPTVALPIVGSTFVQQTLLSILLAPCVYYGLQSAMQYAHIRPDKG
jgi:rod shape-determining protein MreD